MYLSRLFLNPMDRRVRRDTSNPHEMHRTVMSAFPDVEPGGTPARERYGVLHRLDEDRRTGRLVLYVQSAIEPNWGKLPEGFLLDLMGELDNPATRSIDRDWEVLSVGSVRAFRLRANPTRRIDTKSGEDGKRRNGRRVLLTTEEAQVAWLRRKAQEGGFELLGTSLDAEVSDVLAIEERPLVGRRSKDGDTTPKAITIKPVLFEGRLRITNVERFREVLTAGLGPGKAYGFGLLSLAPAHG